MNDGAVMEITVLAFGPLAEELGWKRHQITLPDQHNVRQIVQSLGLEGWKEN